jgi:hypothetical protein
MSLPLGTVPEYTNSRIAFLLTDEGDPPVGVPGATITALWLSILDLATRLPLTGWDKKKLWEAGAALVSSVTIDASGNVAINLAPEDAVCVGGDMHQLLVYRAVWPGGGIAGDFDRYVTNVENVP